MWASRKKPSASSDTLSVEATWRGAVEHGDARRRLGALERQRLAQRGRAADPAAVALGRADTKKEGDFVGSDEFVRSHPHPSLPLKGEGAWSNNRPPSFGGR